MIFCLSVSHTHLDLIINGGPEPTLKWVWPGCRVTAKQNGVQTSGKMKKRGRGTRLALAPADAWVLERLLRALGAVGGKMVHRPAAWQTLVHPGPPRLSQHSDLGKPTMADPCLHHVEIGI